MKRVQKLLAILFLLTATLGIGVAENLEAAYSVSVDITEVRIFESAVDEIHGTFDTGSPNNTLTGLSFGARNSETGEETVILVSNISYGDDSNGNDTYVASFNNDTTGLENYDIITVEATFTDHTGRVRTADFEGQLYNADGGQCHEGMCVPVSFGE